MKACEFNISSYNTPKKIAYPCAINVQLLLDYIIDKYNHKTYFQCESQFISFLVTSNT